MPTIYDFTVRATDSLGNVANAPRSIVIQDPAGQPPNSYAGLTSWYDGSTGRMFKGNTADSGSPLATDEALARWDSTSPTNRTLTGACLRAIAGNGGADFSGAKLGSATSLFSGHTTPSGNTVPSTPSPLSNYVSASNAIVIAVVKIRDANANTGRAYANDSVFQDSPGYFGLHCYKLNPTTCRFQGSNWSPSEQVVVADAPFDQAVCVTVRHTGGQLRIRINGGPWASIASGNTSVVTGQVQVARGNGAAFDLDLMQLVTYNANRTDAEVAAVEQFLMARTGITA